MSPDKLASIVDQCFRRHPSLAKHPAAEDLRQAGYLGALEGLSRYRPGHGVPPEGFIRKRVLGAMLNARDELSPGLRYPAGARSRIYAQGLAPADMLPAEEDALPGGNEHEELTDLCQLLSDHLDPRACLVIRATYGLGCPALTRSELALLLGVDPSTISRIRSAATRRLRKILERT